MPSRTPSRDIYSRRARGGGSGCGSGALAAARARSGPDERVAGRGLELAGQLGDGGPEHGVESRLGAAAQPPGDPRTRPPQRRVRARVTTSTSAMAATPATRTAASGLVQSMSPCPRPAAISRKTRPRPWASSGMRAAVLPPLERDRDPEAAEQRHHRGDDARGERRQRPGPDVDRHLRERRRRAGRASTTAPPTPPSRIRVRADIGVSASGSARRSAPREIEQRQPDGRDRVDPRPGGEREPVMDEAVEVQGGRARRAPHEDDDGGEAGRDAMPAVDHHDADEEVARPATYAAPRTNEVTWGSIAHANSSPVRSGSSSRSWTASARKKMTASATQRVRRPT